VNHLEAFAYHSLGTTSVSGITIHVSTKLLSEAISTPSDLPGTTSACFIKVRQSLGRPRKGIFGTCDSLKQLYLGVKSSQASLLASQSWWVEQHTSERFSYKRFLWKRAIL